MSRSAGLLGELPGRALQRLGDHVAVRDAAGGHRLADLTDRVTAAAGGLAGSGVRPGDRVAVVLPNSADTAVTYLALWRLGAVAVPLIAAATAPELAGVLADSGSRAVVAAPATAGLAAAAAGGRPVLRAADLGGRQPAPLPEPPDRPDHLAALLYTGGTTGRAKGVMLSHGNLTATAAARQQVVEQSGTRSLLVPLPLSHVFGLVNLVSRLYARRPGTLHLMERFTPHGWLDLVERHRIEAGALVPSMLQRLLTEPLESRDLTCLTYLTSGGAPLAPATRAELERRVPGVRLCDGYGCTEVCSTATMNPPDARRDGSVGRAIPGVALRVVDADGRPVPPGADGEVCVASPGVMLGYWRDPAATADACRDGWLHTGDIGRLDADGYLTVVDRTKDLIIRGGFNVYPRDVEDALLEHPAVVAAAAVGRPDPVLGEEVVAFVQLATTGPAPGSPRPVTQADLLSFAAARLAGTKRPREIHVVDAVPLTRVGKTDRLAARRLLAALTGESRPG